jgi:hypothetical protein
VRICSRRKTIPKVQTEFFLKHFEISKIVYILSAFNENIVDFHLQILLSIQVSWFPYLTPLKTLGSGLPIKLKLEFYETNIHALTFPGTPHFSKRAIVATNLCIKPAIHGQKLASTIRIKCTNPQNDH